MYAARGETKCMHVRVSVCSKTIEERRRGYALGGDGDEEERKERSSLHVENPANPLAEDVSGGADSSSFIPLPH